MSVRIGHASISENGTIRGSAGDQNGKEVCIRKWYKHSKGWYLIRCKDDRMRLFIAEAMEKACANDDIGYDQSENQTLWDNIKSRGFDPGKTTKKVETDCARLVRVCCQYACEKVGNGKEIPDFYTASLASKLVKTGLFTKYSSDKYCKQDDYLLRGDILVTRSKGHTAVVLDNGDKAEIVEIGLEPVDYDLGERILRIGCEGEDVKELEGYLTQLGYDCGKEDGAFDDSTDLAVREFQADKKLEVDGEYGPLSHAAMQDALKDVSIAKARKVRIVNGNCYVRSAPNTSGKKLGVAYRGSVYGFGGVVSEDGWHLIDYEGKNGWVSGKYSVTEE